MRSEPVLFGAAVAVFVALSSPASAQDPEASGGFSAKEGGVTFHAETVSRLDEGGVILNDVKVSRPETDGVIRIEALLLTSEDILGFTSGACLRAPVSGEAVARGVRFRPDPDAHVPDAENAEAVDIALVTLDVEMSGCGRSVSGPLDGIEVTGVDGSSFSFDGADVKVDLSGSGRVETRVDLVNGKVEDSEGGYAGFSFSEAGFSFQGDQGEVTSLLSLLKAKDIEGFVLNLAHIDAGVGGYIRGMDVDTAKFLPDEDRSRLGLDDVEAIFGDFEVSMGVAQEQARMMTRFDAPGLAKGEAFLRFEVPREKTVLPASVADRLPLPASLLSVSLHRATVSYEDLGLGDVTESATGRRPRDILEDAGHDRVNKVVDRLPGGLGQAARSAWAAVLELADGKISQVGLSPEGPVTLMQAGLSGFSGAGALASSVGAYKDDAPR